MDEDSDMPLLCHRCGCDLTPGEGNFYVVRIEALADPTPPRYDEDEFARWTAEEIDAEINSLLDEMKHLSEQEMMDQVYRRLTIHLCGRCYRRWIENPAGG
ncbi:MAG: hypothetical protein JW849_05575 [Phycisphaerae bacterium]|nr:hypothetical protein [Phycisphaerae bacterium]